MTTLSALVIDDNPLNNDVLVTLLENLGFSTIAIESPQALEAAIQELGSPVLIFLDLEFPAHDGFSVLKQLRADMRLQSSQILACSVHTNAISLARHAGFDGFLGKPLNAHQFRAQIQRVLDGEAIWEI